MAKIINISDKLNMEKPSLQIGDKVYVVNDGLDAVMKFEELAGAKTATSMVEAISVALGKDAAEELQIAKYSVSNFRVLTVGILAAMQDIEYDEAIKKFQL